MPRVFSYGSLQQVDVQRATYGRVLTGHRDELPAFVLALVPIQDPERAAALGKTHHANLEYNGRFDCAVPGVAYEITEQELTATDTFEAQDGYVRIEVTLASGRPAWVYVYGPSPPS